MRVVLQPFFVSSDFVFNPPLQCLWTNSDLHLIKHNPDCEESLNYSVYYLPPELQGQTFFQVIWNRHSLHGQKCIIG
jgi:hypothetical protein